METPVRALQAALYCRISSDPRDQALGVTRQEEDCRALAERHGWSVAAVYVENDTSASIGSAKQRPQYAEMLQRACRGEFGAVVAYSNSRLTRRPREYEDLIELAEKRGVRIVTVVSGEDNLATADGRQMARIKASIDAGEAERTSERVRRAKDAAAKSGKYRGGPRPYGFEVDGVTVREDEAEVIRKATTDVLAGRTLAGIARDLDERGLVTSTGKRWTYGRLRDVLIRPRNAGLLHHGGNAARGEAVIIGEAEWSAVVDEETWRASYALLTDPKRRKQRGNEPKWLGSGLYRCGRCGGPMRSTAIGATPSRGGRRRYYYRCVDLNHLMIRQDLTDEFILSTVARLVRDPRVVAAMQPHGEDLAPDRLRRQVLLTRLENFEADYANGMVTGPQLQKATESVQAELREVDDRLAVSVRRSTASPIAAALDPGLAFLDAPLDVQRAVLTAVLAVEVKPSARRGVAWTPDRLSLTPVSAA